MKFNPCDKCSDRIENATKGKRIEQLYAEILSLEKQRFHYQIWVLVLTAVILILIGVVSR